MRREAAAPTRLGRPFGPATAVPQCLSPTGEILVAETDADGRTTISLLDPAGSRIVAVEPPPGLMPPQWCVFSPDGRTLAQPCHDGRVLLVDARTLAVRAVVGGHAVKVHNLAFSPDGETLATGSLDSVVRLWDVRSGLETLALEGHRGEAGPIAFSPDGRALAAGGGDSNVLVWFAEGDLDGTP